MRDPFEPTSVPILERLGPVFLGRTRGLLPRRCEVIVGQYEFLIVWLNGTLGPPAFAWQGLEESNQGVAHILSGLWVADRKWKSSLASTALKRADGNPPELRRMRIVFPEDLAGESSRAQAALDTLGTWRESTLNRKDAEQKVQQSTLGVVDAKPLVVQFMHGSAFG